VEGPDDLRREWLEGVETVGLTAGTSTPDETIEAVHHALLKLAGAAAVKA
jgi:4-hydroxy-3-methylbut-2-enyl diphosphate reductase